jgi:flagellar biosynthesis protein FlhB
MASTLLFTAMAIIAALLLFIASLTATLGASDAFSSTFYNSDPNIRSAHQYLTIAAALGWSSLVVLIVILIVAAVAGGFTTTEVSEALLTKETPTKADLLAAYRGEKELSAGYTTQIIVLIILIIIAIITLIVGILAIVAAVEIGSMKQKDTKASAAYTEAIIAAVSGVGGIGIMIIAVISYMGIRSAREKKLKEIEQFEKKAETQLGVSSIGEVTTVVGVTSPTVVTLQ